MKMDCKFNWKDAGKGCLIGLAVLTGLACFMGVVFILMETVGLGWTLIVFCVALVIAIATFAGFSDCLEEMENE